MRTLGVVVGGALLLTCVNAHAQRWEAPSEAVLLTPIGMSFSVGGGLTGFTTETMRDFADLGGSWDARLVLGTRRFIAFEAAYVGGAQDIDALGLDDDAFLLSTSAQGLARFNFSVREIQPYIIAGAAWKRYDVTNEDFNTSSVRGQDDVVETPVGAGLAWRVNHFVFDVRGTFRPAFDEDLIRGEDAELHNWDARANLGWEF